MTEREYRQHPAISRSELWRMSESPAKFKWFRDHPPVPTPSLIFGQLVHKLILQPETFNEDFAVMPEFNRRTKAGREAYLEWVDTVDCETVVDADTLHEAQEMASAVFQNRLAARILEDRHDIVTLKSQHEVPFFWTDPDTGEECKCRCDALTVIDDRIVIVDYKTAGSAKTDVFNQSIYKYGYHLQAAMYSEGVMRAMEIDYRPEFWFAVQEKSPPYAVNVVTIPETVMQAGIDVYREYLGIYHQCRETDYWYGYNGPFDEPAEAYLPGWYQLGVEEDE